MKAVLPAAALALAARAGAALPSAGSWLHPSFGAGQLEGETVVVTVLWHANVSAVNEHAPSGAAADVYGAVLDDAIAAAVSSLSARLARLVRTGSDDFGAAVP